MTRNAKARRILRMAHWESKTRQVFYYEDYFLNKNKAPSWLPLRTRKRIFCYGEFE